jgi:hypothetical protein
MLSSGMCIQAQYADGISALHYSNSEGEKAATTYIYNGLGTPYKAVWELTDGSRWSLNYHEFDSTGNMVRKYREFSDSVTIEQTFHYHPGGRLVSETFSRSDGTRGSVNYEYREGKLHKAVCNRMNGWFSGEIRYQYGDSEMKDSAILVMEGYRVGNIMYEYDGRKRLRKEVWQFSSHGFTQTLLYQYKEDDCIPYGSANVFFRRGCYPVVRSEQYDFNGEGGGPSYYEYSEENQVPEL